MVYNIIESIREAGKNIKDALTHKNVENFGVCLPSSYTIIDGDLIPDSEDTIDMMYDEGGIIREDCFDHYVIRVVDVGSVNGHDAHKMRRLISKHWELISEVSKIINNKKQPHSFSDVWKIITDNNLLADVISEYGKDDSLSFEYTEEDIIIKRKIITLSVRLFSDKPFLYFDCCDVSSAKGISFNIYDVEQAVKFASQLNITIVNVHDEDGDLIEKIPTETVISYLMTIYNPDN